MLDISRPLFAFARCHRVMYEQYLRQQEGHGKRTSPTAAVRPGTDPALSLFWSRYDRGTCEYVDDLRDYLRETGARTRKGAALSMHLLLGISPEWLQETGGIHDGCNSRVIRLFEEAKRFAETHIGGVYAMRLDLDERGGGVVDIFAAPTHMRRARLRKDGTRGTDVCEVSVKDALVRMQKAAGGGKSFAALQTLWAHHAATTMDRRILRGVPKKITGREHLSVAEYRESVEKERAIKVELAGKRSLILNSLASLAVHNEEASARERQLTAKDAELAARHLHLADEYALVRDADIVLKQRSAVVEARAADLDQREEGLQREIGTLADRRREAEVEQARVKAEQDARDAEVGERALRLAADEEAARHAAQQAADLQRQWEFMISAAAAKEEELEHREREVQLALDDQRRQRDKIDILQATTEAKDIRLHRREAVLDAREGDLAQATQAAKDAELARKVAHRDRERQVSEAEASIRLRNEAVSTRERDAAQAQGLADQQIGAATHEREMLASERREFAARAAELVAREAAVVEEKGIVAKRERSLAATVAALGQGLKDLGDGRISSAADIAARPHLSPAAELLRRVASTITERVKQVTAGVEAHGLALVAEQKRAAAARVEAEKRSAAAKEAEAQYKKTKDGLLSEVNRARRIRKAARAIVPYAEHQLLQRVPKLAALMKALAVELGAQVTQDQGRDR